MRVIVEVIVAFLAAGGLLALGWFLFGQLLAPVAGEKVFAVIPARGAGERLEHDVSGILWLRAGGMARMTVVIVDDGLDCDGLAVAKALLERENGIRFCRREELEDIL